MTAYKNAIVFVCGMKGQGKTYLAQKIAREAYSAGRRVIVISPQRDISIPGAAVIESRSYPWERLAGRSAVVYPEDDQLSLDAVRFAWEVQADPVRPLWLVIDEIQALLSPHRPDPLLRRVIWYGRHRMISIVGVCQRPAQVNKDLLALADQKIMFRIEEPNDLAYLRKYVGSAADRLNSLAPRKFVAV